MQRRLQFLFRTVVVLAACAAVSVVSVHAQDTSVEPIDLDGIAMNDAESAVETQMIGFFPPCVVNTVRNNTTEGFSFVWLGAGPGGFSSKVLPGPQVGTKWEWDTTGSVWNIQSEITFTPDPALPVFGNPGSGLQGIHDNRTFLVNGLGNQAGGLLSSESLGSSFITFFSPDQTVATCGTRFVPGRSEQTITNESDETVTILVEEGDCCMGDDQVLCPDGCKDYFTDPNNCGGCGIVCGAGASCNVGCCTGTSNCNGFCSDLQTDPLNCGQCGRACSEGQVCDAGSCAFVCDEEENEADCGGEGCTDLDVDPNNCGECGNFCFEDQFCDAGSCTSCDEEGGETYCGDGVCANLSNDPNNCNECGNVCDFSECPTETGTCDGEGGCQCDPEPTDDCCDAGGALDFDGFDDFVGVPSPSEILGVNGTFSAWINWDGFVESFGGGSARQTFLSLTTDFEPGIGLAVSSSGRLIGTYNRLGGSYEVSSSAETIGTGVWTHVAYTFEGEGEPGGGGGGEGGVLTLYVNGTQVASVFVGGGETASATRTGARPAVGAVGLRDLSLAGSVSAGPPSEPAGFTGELYFIGDEGTGENFSFNGVIDEVRIWNVARSQPDIDDSLDVCLTGSEAGLVAYYAFEDGTGSSTLSDLTGNGNDGDLTNMNPASDWVFSPLCQPGGFTCSSQTCGAAVCEYNDGEDCCEGWSSYCAEDAFYVEECGCDDGGGDLPANVGPATSDASPASDVRPAVLAPRTAATSRREATPAPDRRGPARAKARPGMRGRHADRGWGGVEQPSRPPEQRSVTISSLSGGPTRSGVWPITAIPVSTPASTNPQEDRPVGADLQRLGLNAASGGLPEGGCSLIDFEGVPDGGTVGTIEGTPSTTFGPSWTAVVDFDASSSDCCMDNGTPGCEEQTCEEAVCSDEGFEYCCSEGWDLDCAFEAAGREECSCNGGNIANEPSPSTVVTFLVENPEILTRNSDTPAQNAAELAGWLSDIGIDEGQIEYRVDFESGFDDGENIAGEVGRLPGGLVIYDTGPSSSGFAIVRSSGFGTSNPVGTLALAHDEEAYLELDFTANPVDYVAFQDIDQAGTTGFVWFVDGTSTPIALETDAGSGDSAEFFGIFRNTKPRISYLQLDASGDGQWGIDNLLYGRAQVRGGADPIDFDAEVQFIEVFYAASLSSLPVTLRAWDGPGGTGNVVDSVSGDTVGTDFDGAPCTGDPTGAFCLWDSLQLTSQVRGGPGGIRSVTLEGATLNQFGFDNMTFCTNVPETGACCTGESLCTVTTAANCESLGGSYQGDDALCLPTTCGPPFIFGLDEAAICATQPLQETLDPGESETICVPGFRAGREVFTSATIREGAEGQIIARGPCAQIVGVPINPDGFIPTISSVRLSDESGDFLAQPGELLTLDIGVLNVGIDPLIDVSAELRSPPTFFNPLPVTFVQATSDYPNFSGLSDTDLGQCDPPSEPQLFPQTNVVSYTVRLPTAPAGGGTRKFRLVFDGTIPGEGPITATLPVAFGIGRTCDPAGLGGRGYDGLDGFLAPVDADLAPPDYPVDFSATTFPSGQDVLLRLVLSCAGDPSDPSRLDPLPQIGAIEQGGSALPLTGIDADGPDPDNTFFDCSATECSFNLDTSSIPAGDTEIEVIMSDGLRFRAGVTVTP